MRWQVLVATAPTCWGMAAAASLVVIMGTQYFDGSGATGGQDYPVTDLLQMMGRASRPDKDESGRQARHAWSTVSRPGYVLRDCHDAAARAYCKRKEAAGGPLSVCHTPLVSGHLPEQCI